MIVALAGGVGAARFLDGLSQVHPPKEICIIGNTGDDMEMHGLYICPDLDTVVYTLAGLANPVHGWGVDGDSFRCLEALGKLNAETWFQLGDRDLATHIYRTARLRAGESLSTVTAAIARSLGVACILKPVSDDPVRTIVQTPGGPLEFQTYFVRRRAQDEVLGVEFQGAEDARPAPGVLRAIRSASAIVFCPSNPIISIGPILAVPGIRQALRRRKCPAAAISPIIGGRALKGPAADMMRGMGMEVSSLGVARIYRGMVDLFILDRADKRLAPEVEKLGMRAVVTNTIMTGPAQKKALARAVLKALERT
ncbi:MAG: 2-phospho-L-lactate transferase [Bryobacterales bacterium]|nr:2-phospho-L-lactate transferase [Bryobacterales bacterium]